MIAILIAAVALVLSVVSLAAVGTVALRLRLVRPQAQQHHHDDAGAPEEVTLPSAGQPIAAVLGQLIEETLPGPDGPIRMQERFLLTDGPVLITSTSCGSCRYLLHESSDLLVEAGVRVLVAAPTIERGIEFVERDAQAAGVGYQVDPEAERARAIGVSEFPLLLDVTDGRVGTAHVVVTKSHLETVLGDRTGRTPVRAGGENGEG